MVKDSSSAKILLNNIFHSLADPTRRKILELLSREPLTVSQIKKPFKISLVAISKHLKVLERAKLIRRQKMGREHMVRLHSQPLREAHKYIENYKKDWSRQLDALEKFLERNSWVGITVGIDIFYQVMSYYMYGKEKKKAPSSDKE